ncbi:MAG TPA: hypothetical protein VH393_08155 [Ktedonobacterales bacterium]
MPADQTTRTSERTPESSGDENQQSSVRPSRLIRALIRVSFVWLIVALIFWVWYLVAIAFVPQVLYPFLWLGLVGLPVWLWRRPLAMRLRAWRFPGFLKFMVLGYLMVLIEEVFAALVNHLTEGFSWPLFLQRIGQFWALNLFTFTGLFVGWYLLARFIGYSRVEMFFLGGCFGLYSERIIFLLPQGQLLQFILSAPLIIFTYGLILTPAMLSLGELRKPRLIWLLRYPFSFLIPFLCSLPPVLLLQSLRESFPDWFPPRKFIP